MPSIPTSSVARPGEASLELFKPALGYLHQALANGTALSLG